jgi:1,4-alpha-glucan branching enzyme
VNHDTGLDWRSLDDPLDAGVQQSGADPPVSPRDAGSHRLDCDPEGFAWIDLANGAESVLSYIRRCREPHELAVIVCNFTPVPRHDYRIGVPRPGHYRERINTDAQAYGGSGIGNAGAVDADPHPMHGHAYSLSLHCAAGVDFIAEP